MSLIYTDQRIESLAAAREASGADTGQKVELRPDIFSFDDGIAWEAEDTNPQAPCRASAPHMAPFTMNLTYDLDRSSVTDLVYL